MARPVMTTPKTLHTVLTAPYTEAEILRGGVEQHGKGDYEEYRADVFAGRASCFASFHDSSLP